jgi:phosphatidylethanolamine-binding protein (PEBP) family uncharacterized protein
VELTQFHCSKISYNFFIPCHTFCFFSVDMPSYQGHKISPPQPIRSCHSPWWHWSAPCATVQQHAGEQSTKAGCDIIGLRHSCLSLGDVRLCHDVHTNYTSIQPPSNQKIHILSIIWTQVFEDKMQDTIPSWTLAQSFYKIYS